MAQIHIIVSDIYMNEKVAVMSVLKVKRTILKQINVSLIVNFFLSYSLNTFWTHHIYTILISKFPTQTKKCQKIIKQVKKRLKMMF